MTDKAVEDRQHRGLREHLEILGRIVWAALLAGSSVIVAVVLGALVADLLWRAGVIQTSGWYRAGSLAIGVTFLVSAVRHILGSAERVLAWIHARTREPLYPRVMVLAGMVAVIACCIALWREPPDSPASDFEIVYLQPRAEHPQPQEPVATFPVHFRLAKGPEEGWVEGVTLNDGQREQVAKLTQTLLACVGRASGEEVVVSFRGFADENEFRGKTPEQSKKLNQEVADLRAENLYRTMETVREELRSEADTSRLILEEPKSWPSVEAMEKARPFRGRPLEVHPEDQGYLNRRAEIRLESAGACERLRPGETVETVGSTALAQKM